MNENKHVPFLVACAVSLLAFLFLPLIPVFDWSVWDLFDSGVFDNLESTISTGIIVALAGGVIGVIGGAMKKKGTASLGSIVGVIGVVIVFIGCISNNIDMGDIGMAAWIGLIGYIVSAVLANKMEA